MSIIIGVLLLLRPFADVSHAKNSTDPLAPSSGSAKKFAKADQAFRERRDPKKGIQALELYRAYYTAHPQDPEGAWRLGMACYYAGARILEKNEEKTNVFQEGAQAAKVGLKKNPKCTGCYFWSAINTVLYSETVGVFKTLFSLDEVKTLLKKSIEIDPAYMYGGAYRLLGSIDSKLPGILGGNNDRARSYFEKAIETAPEEPLHYLFLARLLDEKYDDRAGALEVARKGLKVPPPPLYRVEAVDAVEDLKAFIRDRPLSN